MDEESWTEHIDINKEDWEVLINFLPMGWREKAMELGAITRLRNFKDSDSLLRTLLIHFVDGCSLRETVVRAKLGKISDVSAVALYKRLNKSGEWLRWMASELMQAWVTKLPIKIFPASLNVRVVDGTYISEPGSTGTDWRIHYSIKLFSLQCDELKVTDTKVGETFKRYAVNKGDLLIGDRGYYHRQGIEYVVGSGGDVLVRANLTNLSLYQKNGKKIHLIKRLRTLHGTQVGDWPVFVQGDKGFTEGRVCAIKKSKADTEKARKKILQESSKKGRKVQPETLESAGYIFVFTTLSEKLVKGSIVLEMYRGRWQIELVFKRLKSIIGLGHLPKQDPIGAKAWIHGKLFAAFLIEALISAGERFFPWGFPIPIEIKKKALFMERDVNDVAFNKSISKSPCRVSEMH